MSYFSTAHAVQKFAAGRTFSILKYGGFLFNIVSNIRADILDEFAGQIQTYSLCLVSREEFFNTEKYMKKNKQNSKVAKEDKST